MDTPYVGVFETPQETISWANKAVDEFEALAHAFILDSNNCGLVVEVDPNTGQKIGKWKLFVLFPADLRRKATEAIINTRHSFDQIFSICVGKVKGNEANFPWSRDPTDM